MYHSLRYNSCTVDKRAVSPNIVYGVRRSAADRGRASGCVPQPAGRARGTFCNFWGAPWAGAAPRSFGRAPLVTILLHTARGAGGRGDAPRAIGRLGRAFSLTLSGQRSHTRTVSYPLALRLEEHDRPCHRSIEACF